MRHARAVRVIRRGISRRSARPETLNSKTRPEEVGRAPHTRRTGKLYLGGLSFPEITGAFKREIRAIGDVCPELAASRRVLLHPGGPMLAFVPVTFDLYRTVRRHLHWTLQNLVAFADRTGRCFPSVRTLAAATGQPRSTVSRHLAQLAEAGVIARQRRPGGVYAYVIASRFLPAARGVSHRQEKGVPPSGRKEQGGKKTGYARARFAKPGISFGEMPDDRAK